MATLTEVSYFSRKAINLGLVLLVVLVIIKIFWGVAVGFWQKFFPPAPPPATVTFGVLPYPNGENGVATPSGTVSYTIETVDGMLPTMPPSMKVFFMTRPGPSFDSFNKMKQIASKVGFSGVPRKNSTTTWRFTDETNPLRILDIDEVSANFRLTYNFLSDLALFNEKNFSSQEELVSTARSYISGFGAIKEDIERGTPTVTYFRLDSGALVPTTSLSSADAVGVTFNRAEIDGMTIVSPDLRQGLVSVLLSGSSDFKKRILEARLFYTPIATENFATYPVISSQQALENLKAGRAIFASLPESFGGGVVIRRVYPAFLDPYPSQSFLQPVLVFSDEKGFVALVPLLTSEWLAR